MKSKKICDSVEAMRFGEEGCIYRADDKTGKRIDYIPKEKSMKSCKDCRYYEPYISGDYMMKCNYPGMVGIDKKGHFYGFNWCKFYVSKKEESMKYRILKPCRGIDVIKAGACEDEAKSYVHYFGLTDEVDEEFLNEGLNVGDSIWREWLEEHGFIEKVKYNAEGKQIYKSGDIIRTSYGYAMVCQVAGGIFQLITPDGNRLVNDVFPAFELGIGESYGTYLDGLKMSFIHCPNAKITITEEKA